ncbi:class I SAM-dependent methyltransferase [Actinacidiphila bryophytorum]|uniref:class I SAM-dependent methyltransferase n=1 Tax=Actinacidiphila bryophytorum TaxID=1436133 RepID=UPI002176BDB4|nr:class I SAM-dependent methyltransferase [Actinacidiphila bryophytorum]UWE11378.1 class I SAM-dependent methyltransferase [Actinacidiphila bryophytorum]
MVALVAVGVDDMIADVACGAGAVALQLVQHRRPVSRPILAVDLSAGMVAVGRARAERLGSAGRIDWRVADAVPLPADDHSLDVVFCASSLHFLGRRALADWRRALRPGGRVAFTLPLAAYFRPSEHFSRHVAHDVPLPASAQEASAWAASCGWTQVESRVHISGTRGVVLTSAVAVDGSRPLRRARRN